MQIYRGSTLILDVQVTDEAHRSFSLSGDDFLLMDFYTKQEVELQRNDTVTAFGETFSITKKPVPVMKKGVFHYNFKMWNTYKELEKVKVFLYDTARDYTQSEYPYTCTPLELVQLLVNNLNAVQSHSWQVGDVIDDESKTITINNQNCLEVLSNAASQWQTEWYVVNYTIYLKKREYVPDPLQALSLGTGIESIEQEDNDKRPLTRLYAFGGTRNLPASYISERLMMDVDYIDSISASRSGDDPPPEPGPGTEVIEDVKLYDDIYPRRLGTVSAVSSDNGIYYFEDSGLDFNPNDYMIDGLAKHVVFMSGALVGYDFEVNYNHGTGKFEIIQYQESSGDVLPGSGLIPSVGDTYIIYNIRMPSTYVDSAEAELKAKAQEYFNANYTESLSFNVLLDEVYFTKHDMQLAPGEIITISHPYINALQGGLNIRVTAFKRYVNRPNKFDNLKVSDVLYTNPVSSMQDDLEEVEEVIDNNNLNSQSYTSRNWRDVAELSTLIDSLQAKLLLIGYESGQFDLVNVIFTPNYQGNPNVFRATAGTLNHKTIPDSDNPGSWTLTSYNVTLTNDNMPYYLYAKCSKTNTTGNWLASTTNYGYDSDPDWYYFLVGVISSKNGDNRSFQTTYGFTEVSGNSITTGIIKSTDGQTYFDLDNGIITGEIMFLNETDQLESLISGGYINTVFIQAESITADLIDATNLEVDAANILGTLQANQINFDGATGNNVDLTGTITAESGQIAGFTIEGYGISDTDANNAYIIIRNSDGSKDARIGSSVFPSSSGAHGAGYFNMDAVYDLGTNTALYARARNAGNLGHAYALWADGLSYINRLRHDAQIVTGGGKLSNDYRMFIHNPSGSSNETIYLPDIAGFEDDEQIIIAHYDAYNTYVMTNDGSTINGRDTSYAYCSLTGKGDSVALIKASDTDWVVISLRGSF